MTDKEKIAKSAASTWCRCFKCDGIVNSTHEKCEKDKLLTCRKWYDGYRTALLAINDYEQQMMKETVNGTFSFGELADGTPIDSIFVLDKEVRSKYKEGDKVKLIIIKEEEQ